MATEFDLNTLVGATGDITSTTLDIILYIVILAAVGLLIWFVWFILQHKYKVEIILLTGGKDVSREDRAREVKRNDGTFWKFLKTRSEIPRPPSEAIYLDNKGKVKARCYQTGSDEFVWLSAQTPDLLTDKEKYYKNFSPLTTKHRGILVQQIRKAEERKRKSLKEYIPMIAGIGAMVIIVVCMLIYWENIAKPAVEINKIAEQNLAHIEKMLDTSAEIQYRQEQLAKELGIEIKERTQGVAPD